MKPIILAVGVLLLWFGEYYWIQLTEWASPLISIITLGFIILFLWKIMTSFIYFIRKKGFPGNLILTSIIYFITLFLLIINPRFLNPEFYQSQIIYRGCYEGTMNTGVIYFRDHGKLDYKHSGFFGMTRFVKGSWTQDADTLFLDFNDGGCYMGRKLLLTDDRFIRIESDTLVNNESGFYRGYCKGLN